MLSVQFVDRKKLPFGESIPSPLMSIRVSHFMADPYVSCFAIMGKTFLINLRAVSTNRIIEEKPGTGSFSTFKQSIREELQVSLD